MKPKPTTEELKDIILAICVFYGIISIVAAFFIPFVGIEPGMMPKVLSYWIGSLVMSSVVALVVSRKTPIIKKG